MPRLGFALLVGTVLLVACGGDDCDPSGNYCDGQILFACPADGGERIGNLCPAGTGCQGTRCYPEPLEACKKDVPQDGRRCDLANRRPGTCTDDGFMWWDDGGACDLSRGGDVCREGFRDTPQDIGEAMCVLAETAHGTCRPDALPPPATCSNNLLLKCAPIGYWMIDRDCGAEGLTCAPQSKTCK